jgi:nucleotide-binding universal stress UspA family protein
MPLPSVMVKIWFPATLRGCADTLVSANYKQYAPGLEGGQRLHLSDALHQRVAVATAGPSTGASSDRRSWSRRSERRRRRDESARSNRWLTCCAGGSPRSDDAAGETLLNEAREHAPKLLEAARAMIQDAQPNVHVSVKVAEGTPKSQIVQEAHDWGADVVLVGAHGWGITKRMLLGSVSHAVASHAPCSVELVRARGTT